MGLIKKVWLSGKSKDDYLWPSMSSKGVRVETKTTFCFSASRLWSFNKFIPKTFHIYPRHIRAKHLWTKLSLNWETLAVHMYTSHPGNLFHEPLKVRPFESTNDEFVFDQTRYNELHWAWANNRWPLAWAHMEHTNTQGELVLLLPWLPRFVILDTLGLSRHSDIVPAFSRMSRWLLSRWECKTELSSIV